MIIAVTKLYNTLNVTPIQVVTTVPQTKRDTSQSHNSELSKHGASSFASHLKEATERLSPANELHSNADETFTYNERRELQAFYYIPRRVYTV